MSNRCPGFSVFAAIAAAGSAAGVMVAWASATYLPDMPLIASLAAGGGP